MYPPATYTTMTTDREDMEPVPEKEAQPSDIAKAAMLVRMACCCGCLGHYNDLCAVRGCTSFVTYKHECDRVACDLFLLHFRLASLGLFQRADYTLNHWYTEWYCR